MPEILWTRIDAKTVRSLLGDAAKVYEADVHDGRLRAIVDKEADGWHVSISHSRRDGQGWVPGRYPDWDEIADARYRFVPNRLTMMMLLPPREQYVNVHPTTFHLWETAPEQAMVVGGA